MTVKATRLKQFLHSNKENIMYNRGSIIEGKVIGKETTFVGNQHTGFKEDNYVIVDDSGNTWVCFANGKNDYASYTNMKLPFISSAYNRMVQS